MAYPDFSKTSNIGIGAVLSQKDNLGRDQAIYYASRLLNSAERNYSTIERELLAIVYAVEKFRYYLLGKEFIITTDHSPITYLNNIKLSSARLTRWRLKLSEYNFKIFYKKGKHNGNADALSRLDDNSESDDSQSSEDLIEQLLTICETKINSEKIIYKTGNIFDTTHETAIAVCTNKKFKIKNGFALEIKNKFNGLFSQQIAFAKYGSCLDKLD